MAGLTRGSMPMFHRLIGSQVHWIPGSLVSPRKQLSLSEAHGYEMVKLTRGQTMVKLTSGQAMVKLIIGQVGSN